MSSLTNCPPKKGKCLFSKNEWNQRLQQINWIYLIISKWFESNAFHFRSSHLCTHCKKNWHHNSNCIVDLGRSACVDSIHAIFEWPIDIIKILHLFVYSRIWRCPKDPSSAASLECIVLKSNTNIIYQSLQWVNWVYLIISYMVKMPFIVRRSSRMWTL